MDVEELARAIIAARQEKDIWANGFRAFQREGLRASNPHPPESPEHRFWQDGFEEARAGRFERDDS